MANQAHKTRAVKAAASLPVINPHAAGIDVGSTKMFVCVPPDSCPEPIGIYDTFTQDLQALSAWLKECDVRTVAMESTGVYWIPLFQILEHAGFEVILVNPNYAKKPRKTDVEDCQWLQYLHAVGLLTPSYRPAQQVCAVRSIMRQRSRHVKQAAAHILHMQKALTEMNLLLHNVISDITGVTGLAIIDAILAGERNPHKLAQLRHGGIKATPDEIAKSLVGDYRHEHLFALKQAREVFSFCHTQMAECDAEIAGMLAQFDSRIDPDQHPIPKSRTSCATPRKNEMTLAGNDMRTEMYRILGVDLTQVPGLGALTVHGLFCEIGNDLSAFASAGHFASWLGLCPDHRISGGKVLSKTTRRVKSRSATLLRVSAQALARSQSYLGGFYRRMKSRFGPVSANTATAHKLARIIYHMLTTKQPYDESKFDSIEKRFNEKRIQKLQKDAQYLGFKCVQLELVS
jgi:transposase